MKLTPKERKLIQGYKIGTTNEVVKNPYTGIEVELCPEAVAIYDLVRGAEAILNKKADGLLEGLDIDPVKVEEIFFATRDIFIRNWPKEYSILLD